MAHMSLQLDFLQEANQKLERLLEAEKGRSQELEGRVAELEQKNSAICRELKAIDELAGQLEEDKKSAVGERNSRVAELEVSEVGVGVGWERCVRCGRMPTLHLRRKGGVCFHLWRTTGEASWSYGR